MSLKNTIKISLAGTIIEAIGLVLDVLHHLNIGLATPEGLINFNHSVILIGFVITAVGVVMTFLLEHSNTGA